MSGNVLSLEKLLSQLALLMAHVKKILNIMAMFGKPSSHLDSIIYFNKSREPDLMSYFVQPGSIAAMKACRRTRSSWNSSSLMSLGCRIQEFLSNSNAVCKELNIDISFILHFPLCSNVDSLALELSYMFRNIHING
ncbi:UNVERIFIED_CONTAM: hypothetical protein NCL1_48094 [Trichonephila clavipes]